MLPEHGLPIAPSSYYAARAAQHGRSRRAYRDEHLKDEIRQVHAEILGVDGARKVWLALSDHEAHRP